MNQIINMCRKELLKWFIFILFGQGGALEAGGTRTFATGVLCEITGGTHSFHRFSQVTGEKSTALWRARAARPSFRSFIGDPNSAPPDFTNKALKAAGFASKHRRYVRGRSRPVSFGQARC